MNKTTTKAKAIHGLPHYCQNNPLIPKGVFPTSWTQLYATVARLPDATDSMRRNEDSFTRLLNLAELEDFYFPAARDLRSAIDTVRMILKGLSDRKPNAAYWRAHDSERNALLGEKSHLKSPPRSAVANSMAIVGISGGGKSTSIRNLLSTIPQVIEHDQSANPLLPRYQILWLKVACPVNRTPRAFMTEIFDSFDRLVNSNYSKACKSENDDDRIILMGSAARNHFLGVLVIDEIQNAAGKDISSDRRLMKLIVRIAETIGVPLIFIGTPKANELLNAELADARRMLGPLWLPYSDDSKDWNLYLDVLCKIQYTRTETLLDPAPAAGPPTPGGLREKFFELTQGIPALAKALWGLAQERAIMNTKHEPTETITTKVLQDTFDHDMRSVAPAVAALRTKMGLDVYDDLLPKELPKPRAWEKDLADYELITRDCFQETLVRAARKKAREKAEDMFESPIES